jgi:SAM-dependent methyltransferase
MTLSEVEQVQRYYDHNTQSFLRYGQAGALGTIRRALWGPGVENAQQAFHYVDQLVADRLRALRNDTGALPHVVDLGCGVGASLCFIARAMPLRGTGITLSPVQVELAARRFTVEGLADRLRVLHANFCALPPELPPADVAYAIESFLHGDDPARFFTECARLIRPGGLLLLCDDMLGERASERGAALWLERFRRGWHVHTLLSPAQISALAVAAGFAQREVVDLTPYLELGRARDLGIAVLMRALGWLPIATPRWSNLLGGHALQVCLQRAYVTHKLIVYERL